MTRRKSSAALAAAALVLSLSACGDTQTVEEACQIAGEKTRAIMGDLGSVNAADPAAAESELASMADQLDGIADGLTNKEVKDAIAGVADSFEDLGEALGGLTDQSGDLPDVQKTMETVNQISDDMVEKGAAIEKLCG